MMIWKKIQWVCELLIRENPRKYTARTLAESCGWDRGPTDDAIYDLLQRGIVKMNNDSTLEQGDYVEFTTPEGHFIRYRRGSIAYMEGI